MNNQCQLNVILDVSVRDQFRNVAENTGTTQRLLVVRLIKDHLRHGQLRRTDDGDLVEDILESVEKARGINTPVAVENPCQFNMKIDGAMRNQLKLAAEEAGTSQRQLVAILIRDFLLDVQQKDPRLLQPKAELLAVQ